MKYAIVSFVVCFLACSTVKKTKVTQEEMIQRTEVAVEMVDSLPCDHSATMILSDNVECGVMIRLSNQLLLQPTEIPNPEEFRFVSGGAIRVSYKILEDLGTSCSQAFAVAQVSCLENDFNVGSEKSKDCEDVLDIFDVKWMASALKSMDARKVSKALFKEQPIYIFENKSAAVYFNCYGTELCRMRPGEESNCHEVIAGIDNVTVILVVNN